MPERTPVVVLGGGPAGLGAAYRLARRGAFEVTVLERNHFPGGNAGSFELAGMRVDFGSHRLHRACPPEILADIRAMLGTDLLARPRHGRMRLRGCWVHFPLKPLDLAMSLPVTFSLGVAADAFLKRGGRPAETFEGVLERGLGRTICRDFYFPYARKIWGVDPSELDAEQARRRVSAGSLLKLLRKVLGAVPGLKAQGAGGFFYPRRGFGQISEAYYCAAVKAGARVQCGATVTGIDLCDGAAAVRFRDAAGERCVPARAVLSTIPISALARVVSPKAPAEVLTAAAGLRFRAMILVYLVLETERFSEYDAHYFAEPSVPITRLSEPKNYGLAQLPGRTVLCAELPCAQSDAVWQASDGELGELALDAIAAAGLRVNARVSEVATRRLPQAYPIYTRDYRRHFDCLDGWLNTLGGIVTFGRQGLFAHDNTHHTLAMAYALDECLDSAGRLDRARWEQHRRAFTHHVVED
jgi:protoporphyrinogen oxidase